jgi:hypothetical protein
MTHDGVSVLGVQLDDPVVAAERPEELDLQFGLARARIRHPGNALASTEVPVECTIATLVLDSDATIVTKGV